MVAGGKRSYLMGTTYCSFSSCLQPGRALVLQPTPQCGADVLLLKEIVASVMTLKIILEYHKYFYRLFSLPVNLVGTIFMFSDTRSDRVYLFSTEGRVGSVRQSALVVDVIHDARWQHRVVVIRVSVLGGLVLQTVPPASTVCAKQKQYKHHQI